MHIAERNDLKEAASLERALIKSEEAAEERLLKAQAKHAHFAKLLVKAQKEAQKSAQVLHQAQEQLQGAQRARAAGPVEREEPAEDSSSAGSTKHH